MNDPIPPRVRRAEKHLPEFYMAMISGWHHALTTVPKPVDPGQEQAYRQQFGSVAQYGAVGDLVRRMGRDRAETRNIRGFNPVYVPESALLLRVGSHDRSGRYNRKCLLDSESERGGSPFAMFSADGTPQLFPEAAADSIFVGFCPISGLGDPEEGCQPLLAVYGQGGFVGAWAITSPEIASFQAAVAAARAETALTFELRRINS